MTKDKESFNFISPGEIQKGQFLTIFRLKPVEKLIGVTPAGEKILHSEQDSNPWIQGIPFRVKTVNLPLVMLENICNVPNIPPAVFWNTLLADFLEVDKEYVKNYRVVMNKYFAKTSSPAEMGGDITDGSNEEIIAMQKIAEVLQNSQPEQEVIPPSGQSEPSVLPPSDEENSPEITDIEAAFLRGFMLGKEQGRLAAQEAREDLPLEDLDEQLESSKIVDN